MDLDCNLDPYTSSRNVVLGYVNFSYIPKMCFISFSFNEIYIYSPLPNWKPFLKSSYKKFPYKNLNPRSSQLLGTQFMPRMHIGICKALFCAENCFSFLDI